MISSIDNIVVMVRFESRTNYWLRSVASSSNFSIANNNANANYNDASNRNYCRPLDYILNEEIKRCVYLYRLGA